jgi:hypothetical protein
MKHNITAMLCVAEYGEREWLLRQIGIASIMSFIDRIVKLIPLETY